MAPWLVLVLVESLDGVCTWSFQLPTEGDAREYFADAARATARFCVQPTAVYLRAPSGETLASSAARPAATRAA
jgi:hypothetical protein